MVAKLRTIDSPVCKPFISCPDQVKDAQSGCGFSIPGGTASVLGSVSTRRVPSTLAESVSLGFSVLLVLQESSTKTAIEKKYFIATAAERIVPTEKPVQKHRLDFIDESYKTVSLVVSPLLPVVAPYTTPFAAGVRSFSFAKTAVVQSSSREQTSFSWCVISCFY